MALPEDMNNKIEDTVKIRVEQSRRVFNLTKRIQSDLNYKSDEMEQLLVHVQGDIKPTYKYAYAKGQGTSLVVNDVTLSGVIDFIADKTT